MPVDIQSLLIWVIAGGAAGLLSWAFDQLPFTDELGPAAKQLIMFGGSALLSIGAVYLQQSLTQEQITMFNPYVTAVLALVPIVFNQLTFTARRQRAAKSEYTLRG
jgi:hypothetical protein